MTATIKGSSRSSSCGGKRVSTAVGAGLLRRPTPSYGAPSSTTRVPLRASTHGDAHSTYAPTVTVPPAPSFLTEANQLFAVLGQLVVSVGLLPAVPLQVAPPPTTISLAWQLAPPEDDTRPAPVAPRDGRRARRSLVPLVSLVALRALRDLTGLEVLHEECAVQDVPRTHGARAIFAPFTAFRWSWSVPTLFLGTTAW